jgi:hypothetical protein
MIWTAFLLGFLGSMHCAGMCGPLALALKNGGNEAQFYLNRFFYNTGRLITYSVLGLIAGSIGAVISLAGLQQALSITMGLLLLLAALTFLPWLRKFFSGLANPLHLWLKKGLAHLLQRSSPSGFASIGLLNGLLPCGLVYTALAGAAVTGTSLSGAAFMAVFGIGTLPMMLAISWSGEMIPVKWRTAVMKIYPYITIAVAVLLILRGMNLGIPFLSPDLSSGTCKMCHEK